MQIIKEQEDLKNSNIDIIGIIAGMGNLPKIIANDARQRGIRVVTVALENLASEELTKFSDEIRWINVGKLGSLIDALKCAGVKKVLMAGKVPKSLLYKSKIMPDLRATKLLFTLKDRSDDAILRAITAELQKEGITVIDTCTFSPHLVTPKGVLTEEPPSKDEWKDIEFGYKIAKKIGELDIGQTVVIKTQAVIAVEAIEGTDEAILRGGKLAGDGAVVVKVSKPGQDMRLDVPVVGLSTLKSMIQVRARVLAIEAEKSIMIGKERLIKEADEAGISIVGFK
jgi:DUF1009 family protein